MRLEWEIWKNLVQGLLFNLKFAKRKYLEISSEISPGLNFMKSLCFSKFIPPSKPVVKDLTLISHLQNFPHLYSYIVQTKQLNDGNIYYLKWLILT